MGFRNPWKFSVDPTHGLDRPRRLRARTTPPTRRTRAARPASSSTTSSRQPGNYGWPLCMGNNEPFRDVDYMTTPVTVGPFFDCANPVNDSIKNTGLRSLPPVKRAGHVVRLQKSSVPGAIPAGGGLAPMGGPFYRYDAALDVGHEVPAVLRRQVLLLRLGQEPASGRCSSTRDAQGREGQPVHAEHVFLAPQSLAFGPDGSLYALEWGGGYGRDNPNSGIYRIDYINGSRSPVATAIGHARQRPGAADRHVLERRLGRPRGRRRSPTRGTSTATARRLHRGQPDAHLHDAGVYQARLTVTDPAGKDGTRRSSITVGNTKPTVKFNGPVNGGFVEWGDRVELGRHGHRRRGHGRLRRPDRPAGARPRLHAHPLLEYRGKTGSVVTDLGSGHSEDMKVFFALDARYTDKGDGGVPALTGTDTVILQPKRKEAEHADGHARHHDGADAGDVESPTQALTRPGRRPLGVVRPGRTSPGSTRSRSASPRRPRAARSSCARTPDRRPARHGGGAVDRQHRTAGRTSRSRRRDDGVDGPVPRVQGHVELPPELHRVQRQGPLARHPPDVKITAPAENAAVPAGPGHVHGRRHRRREHDHQGRVLRRRRRRSARTRRRRTASTGRRRRRVLRRPRGRDERQGPDRRLAQGALLGR